MLATPLGLLIVFGFGIFCGIISVLYRNRSLINSLASLVATFQQQSSDPRLGSFVASVKRLLGQPEGDSLVLWGSGPIFAQKRIKIGLPWGEQLFDLSRCRAIPVTSGEDGEFRQSGPAREVEI
jgi:hypothetical protein